MARVLRQVVGFDDAPFARGHRGAVLVVGTVFAGTRLDGVLTTRVWRDGRNATERLASLLASSRFAPQLQLVMLQGIALAGFNVVDVPALHEATGLPVLVVMRRYPDLERIREVLWTRVPGGRRKWALILRAGPVEAMAGVYVQRVGLGRETAVATLRFHARHGKLPEPLRVAHLIAAGVVTGESRHHP